MKRVIFVVFLLVFSSVYFAQSPVSKGVYTIGGNISFSSVNNEENNNTKTFFTFAPRVGYFFINNFYSAINVRYNYWSDNDESQSSYGIGPAVRYFLDASSNIKPFLGFGFDYYIYDGANLTQTTISFETGVDFFITRYFAIEGNINYSITNQKTDSDLYSNESKRNIFSILFGANYFIN